MRTYIGPIGFNPTSVTRPILSHGLEHGDAVILIRPEDETDDRRAEETLADIERNLGALEPDITTDIKRIPHEDFGTALVDCQRIIREAKGRRILLIGGGARDVLVPLTIAGLSLTDCIDLVLGFSDIDHAVRELTFPNLTAQVNESALETLSAIHPDHNTTLPDMADGLDHSKSSITRHVNELDEQGLVETWRKGRTKHVRLTITGRLLRNGNI